MSLSVENRSPNDATLSYFENGQMKEVNISKGGMAEIIVNVTSYQQPAQMEFKSFQKGTNTALTLNGKDTLMVQPTEEIMSYSVVLNGGNYLLIIVFVIDNNHPDNNMLANY